MVHYLYLGEHCAPPAPKHCVPARAHTTSQMCTLAKTSGNNEPPTRLQQVRTNHFGCDLSSGSGSAKPLFQIFAKLNGDTKTINVALEWTQSEVKAALAAKTGRFLGEECYFVAPAGKAMNDGKTTIGQCGLGKASQLEVRVRVRGGGGVLARICCGTEKVEAEAEAEVVPTSEPASAAPRSTDATTFGVVTSEAEAEVRHGIIHT